MILLKKFLKLLIAVFSVIGLFAFSKIILFYLIPEIYLKKHFLTFISGGFLYILAWLFYFSKRKSFWSILEHELTHALFALIFFKRIHYISASKHKGGMIKVDSGNVIIALAPYFFPLLTIILLILKPFLLSKHQPYLNFLLGFTYFFHLLHVFREFHFDQSDIRESGIIFSSIIILFLNIFFLGLILAALSGAWTTIAEYLELGWQTGSQNMKIILNFIFNFLKSSIIHLKF